MHPAEMSQYENRENRNYITDSELTVRGALGLAANIMRGSVSAMAMAIEGG